MKTPNESKSVKNVTAYTQKVVLWGPPYASRKSTNHVSVINDVWSSLSQTMTGIDRILEPINSDRRFVRKIVFMQLELQPHSDPTEFAGVAAKEKRAFPINTLLGQGNFEM